ncbi:penicillin-binding protein 2 [Campylobacter sp. CCS1377]|uniref:Penicillin-binding protein 2 n=1 Tax=Campylobacter sp. CCS1377 TaxID=3158229 RepID=A0AAU7E760_9BACT
MRMRVVIIFIIIFFILLLSRIYYLSIKSNVYYEEMAQQNAIKTQFLAPVRGEISDANGKLLATNDLGFSISIKPYLSLRKSSYALLQHEIEELTNTFKDLNATVLYRTYKKNDSYYNQDYVEVVDFIDYATMIPHFSRLNLRENIRIKPAVKRQYPYKALASHIIGYVGKVSLNDISENEIAKLTNYIGKSGVELYYNEVLQGEKGVRQVKVNALNQELGELFYKQANSKDIQLSIDIELQEYLAKLFSDNAGTAIVMNLEDGSILAAGSFPEYDLNPFVTGISVAEWKKLSNSLDHPFTNKLVNGLYPPGSVVKMGVGLSFMGQENINASTQFFCSGSIELGGRNFRCWNRAGHKQVDLKSAIKGSCDVYFYEAGLRVGIDQISSMMSRIGFGVKTGVDLPNEFVGTVPSREWKMLKFNQPWYQGETLNTSIGQGNFLVTPMQVAKYTAAIAKGVEITPTLLKSIDNNLTQSKQKEEIFNVFEKSQLPLIRQAMYEVANEQGGTAYRYYKDLPLTVAAKTGTAQVVGFSQAEKQRIKEEDFKYYLRSHAWITSYAPYQNPKYVVTVLVEHGGRSLSAGPISAKIYEKLIEMGYLQRKN